MVLNTIQKKCCNDCCTFQQIHNYKLIQRRYERKTVRTGKAGFIIINTDRNSILLVQNYGSLWGIPKGTRDDGETPFDCAKRELEEETGIRILPSFCADFPILSLYRMNFFYIFFVTSEIKAMVDGKTDATGAGWIQIGCIDNTLKLNKQCSNILKKIFDDDGNINYTFINALDKQINT